MIMHDSPANVTITMNLCLLSRLRDSRRALRALRALRVPAVFVQCAPFLYLSDDETRPSGQGDDISSGIRPVRSILMTLNSSKCFLFLNLRMAKVLNGNYIQFS